MPRGIPVKGFRETRARREANSTDMLASIPFETRPEETDEQISARIADRFDILDILIDSCIQGDSRALICSGPAGLGKSHTVERALSNWDPTGANYTIIKGFVRPTGLIKALFAYKNPGQVIVFDDADAIFFDDVSLNLLKAVCDTTEKRTVSWLSEGALIDDDSSERIPRSFQFDGSIIFLTNYDFDTMIGKGHKLAPHLEAMVSRAHYVDLSMKSKRDYLVRIYQVIGQGLLDHLEPQAQADVIDYIAENFDSLRELSLRMAIKIGAIRKSTPNDWRRICNVTCCKNM